MQLSHVPSFRLPVNGRVLVVHGGRDVQGNHHVDPAAPQQRYAYDLLGVDAAGNAVRPGEDGDRAEEWTGFGMELVAPAAGTVVDVLDGLPDMPVFQPSRTDHPAGNHVVIGHDDGSFTWLGHMRRGSVVGGLQGRRVVAGERLGELGNSGYTDRPHLHVHRQQGAQGLFDPAATGVGLAFTGVRLLGRYRMDPAAGFVDWKPAGDQPAAPHVGRRGEVLENEGSAVPSG